LAFYILKIFITTLLIILVAELSKRSSLYGALLASVPLVSVLAMVWLYIDTRDVGRISTLSSSIFWLVIPSLAFFLALPILLRAGLGFYLSLFISIGITVLGYLAIVALLGHFGIEM